MAGAFTTVDLSQLPAPAVVEQLSFESIVADMIADLQSRDPTFTALLESDPAYKIIEVCAYRETLLRQRANDACYGVMLAFAAGADLDQLGANVNVQRLLLDAGDPTAVPPVPPTYESDNDFRARIQLSAEGYTTAGSEGSYVYHALSADGDVKDASAISPAPGQVTVYVLSRTGDGTADATLLNTVAAAINADDVRPMTDQVTVLSASIVDYTITATLTLYPGPDSGVVLLAAQTAAQQYVADMHRLGYDIARSAILGALQQPGVQSVSLTSPAADIAISDGQASYCTAITVTVAGSTNV